MRSIPLLLAAFAVLVASPSRAATPISSCGAIVTGDGELTADIDCTGSNDPAVTLKKGSLSLNGFTITGSPIGVQCLGKCRVSGPGTIREANVGINGFGKLAVTNVDVDHNEYIGIQCFQGCKVTGGSVTNTDDPENPGGGEGVISPGKLELDGVLIANNGLGALARDWPKHHGNLAARNTTFSGNGIGAIADNNVKLLNSSVTGNLGGGVVVGDIIVEPFCPKTSRTVKLKNTTVAGNGGGDGCGTTRACADLMTCRRPKLNALSSCGTSYVYGSGLPGSDWDVCSGD